MHLGSPIWSQLEGRRGCVFLLVTSLYGAIICVGWSHTLCTCLAGAVISATGTGPLWAYNNMVLQTFIRDNIFIPASNALIHSSCSRDTNATLSALLDSDPIMNLQYLPMAIVLNNFWGSQWWRYCHNLWNSSGLCCWLYWKWVSPCQMSSSIVVSIAVAGLLQVTGKWHMYSHKSSPVWSKHWITNTDSATFSSGFRSMDSPCIWHVGLWPKINYERFFFKRKCSIYQQNVFW